MEIHKRWHWLDENDICSIVVGKVRAFLKGQSFFFFRIQFGPLARYGWVKGKAGENNLFKT